MLHTIRMTSYRISVVLGIALLATIFVGCGVRSPSAGATGEVEFEVDPELLDSAYENRALGVAFRPPRDWIALSPEQRQGVSEGLAREQGGQEFSLEIVDVFLETQSLSFASLSRVIDADGPTAQRSDYLEHYWANLEAGEEDDLRSRASFTVNGLNVEQIRHSPGDRITFTLITTAGDGTVIQFDYSIPESAYATEAPKLESSIGTLSRIVG